MCPNAVYPELAARALTAHVQDDNVVKVTNAGPLAGMKILEIESIGPGPFAAMLLGDLGANVLRLARPMRSGERRHNPVLDRGRSGAIELDLKSPEHRARALQLISRADALVEGFRPGVMERLGLGPDECLASNPRLIYGRVTGWGRAGPLAKTAGHDINYIALSGALYSCGTEESGPIPPLNLVGDFGGGGLLLALGIVAALLEARSSGKGQIVDTAMVDGAGLLMSMIYGMRANGRWPAPRAGNVVDGSAYFYRCYACACGGWMAVGAIELEFRRLFLEKIGLLHDVDAILCVPDSDPTIQSRIAAIFASQSRSHWQQVFEGSDACVTPVLSLDEVTESPQNRAWKSFEIVDGVTHPMPAPRFSRTPLAVPGTLASEATANLANWNIPSVSSIEQAMVIAGSGQ